MGKLSNYMEIIISLRRLRDLHKKLLINRKLTLWIIKNKEINVFNYWFLRLINYKDWKQKKVKKDGNI